tara:strand:+ start:2928 stop:3674 length:747 start_codon:yes stop_codon:yes gene_type:complete
LRFFIKCSYNGSKFHGWQRQNNAISIQQKLEEALNYIQGEPIKITGAGRTDTGVHALEMFAHFDVIKLSHSKKDFIFKLNSMLPKSISIKDILKVKDDANARFDAISRTYEYFLSQNKDPFNYPNHYFIKDKLDWELMNKAASLLLNYNDFKCFSKSNTDVKTYDCKIKSAVWEYSNNKAVFKITANRFLRNMVRAIVGTLIEVGIGKKKIDNLKLILESRDRSLAGYSVPANGLFLTKIIYPKSIFI